MKVGDGDSAWSYITSSQQKQPPMSQQWLYRPFGKRWLEEAKE
jgi:hypothetical protein